VEKRFAICQAWAGDCGSCCGRCDRRWQVSGGDLGEVGMGESGRKLMEEIEQTQRVSRHCDEKIRFQELE